MKLYFAKDFQYLNAQGVTSNDTLPVTIGCSNFQRNRRNRRIRYDVPFINLDNRKAKILLINLYSMDLFEVMLL